MPTIARIKKRQASLAAKSVDQLNLGVLPAHEPEILLIGCVDARLDIIGDLGIPKGKALVYRNIAALVQGRGDDPSDLSHMSETAALEFAISVMKVRHVVVMGHTDCGGIRACLKGAEKHKAIHQYLSSLNSVRDAIISEGGDMEAQARAMEMAAVAQSIENLKSYYVVSDALAESAIELHGWVINTADGKITEVGWCVSLNHN